MARGTSFGELMTKLRIAARYDPNPALSKNMEPLMRQTLQDTQERLYDEFDWPFLRVHRDKVLSAGQRFYDFPDDLNLERTIKVDVRHGSEWLPVERGITLDEYSLYDSEADVRCDPVLRWEVMDTGGGEQMEVWPLPATNNAQLRLTGIRKLKPLVEASDIADLDDQLIVAFAAGELLGGAKNPVAQVKFQQGARRLELLQGRSTKTRHNTFVLGGAPSDRNMQRQRAPLVAYVRD